MQGRRVSYSDDRFHQRARPSVLRELDRMLAAEIGLNGRFVFFETGRSFHGYLPDLIPEHAWPKYLGSYSSSTRTTAAFDRHTMGRACSCEGLRGASLEPQYEIVI